MDSARAEREGVSPLKPALAAINVVSTRPQLIREIALLQKNGSNVLFDFSPNADPKDADHYIAWISQAGLGMPDRDYYTKTDPASDSLRQKYMAHVAKTLALAGEPAQAAAGDARRIMALETELAKASMTRVERRESECDLSQDIHCRFAAAVRTNQLAGLFSRGGDDAADQVRQRIAADFSTTSR